MSAPPVCAAVTVHEPHAQTQQDPTIALVTILTQEMEELVILWRVTIEARLHFFLISLNQTEISNLSDRLLERVPVHKKRWKVKICQKFKQSRPPSLGNFFDKKKDHPPHPCLFLYINY